MRFLCLILACACSSRAPQADRPNAEQQKRREVLLGQALFEDENLSSPPGQSCESCHLGRLAFTGSHRSFDPAIASGAVRDVFGERNVPTIMYARFVPAFGFEKDGDEWIPVGGLFWDGRVDSLAEQAGKPLLNHLEMNNQSKSAVVEKVRAAEYAPLVRSLYGDDIFNDTERAFTAITRAIAAFEKTEKFAPFSSKFDRVLRGQDTFSAQEARGFELFKDKEKGNCLACHAGDVNSNAPSDWLFTDHTYDGFGVPRNPIIPANKDANYFDLGLCKQKERLAKQRGFVIDSVCGAFRVPTLRNIAKTAPYMHNGRFKTLREVVDFYATRDTHPQKWYTHVDGNVRKFDDVPPQYRKNINTSEAPYDRKPGEAPRLTDDDIDAIVAFLQTLTDE